MNYDSTTERRASAGSALAILSAVVRSRRSLVWAVAIVAFCGLSTALAAGDRQPKSPWDLKLFRFEFDNDTFLGSDDAFTAGWSFQVHSRVMDRWNPAFAGWIGKLPGLGDDGQGRRVARWAFALSQIILTPEDISIAAPQPNDTPWAGILGASGTWSSYDNKRLGAMQLYLGCMGPCSQAEHVQKFVHEDLGFGETPEGWANQLSNKPLTNLKGWRFYFNLTGRYAWITYLAPAEGGPTENGGTHPALDSYPGAKQGLLGVHLPRAPFSVHLTYYRYFGSLPSGLNGGLDWVNFSFEYRF